MMYKSCHSVSSINVLEILSLCLFPTILNKQFYAFILFSHAPFMVLSTDTTQCAVAVAAEVRHQISELEADKRNHN